MQLTLPDASAIYMDEELLGQCWWLWKNGGHATPPHPLDVAALPRDYFNQLVLYDQGVMFYHDFPDRPKHLR